jgi:Gti1/Pac2 family transcription factor
MAPEPPKQVNGSSSVKPEESPSDAKPHENGTSPTSVASQAPTIKVLVHGSFISELTDAAKGEEGGERPGSLSPGGTKKSGAPQDIPSEKLGFREDKRALRQLDKVFTA